MSAGVSPMTTTALPVNDWPVSAAAEFHGQPRQHVAITVVGTVATQAELRRVDARAAQFDRSRGFQVAGDESQQRPGSRHGWLQPAGQFRAPGRDRDRARQSSAAGRWVKAAGLAASRP